MLRHCLVLSGAVLHHWAMLSFQQWASLRCWTPKAGQVIFTGPGSFPSQKGSTRERKRSFYTQIYYTDDEENKEWLFWGALCFSTTAEKSRLVASEKLVSARHSFPWSLELGFSGSPPLLQRAALLTARLRPPGSSAEIPPASCHYPQIMGCLFSWRTAGAVVHTLLIETLAANILFLSIDSDSLIECTAPSSLPWKWSYCHQGLTLSTSDTWEHSILVWSADALTDVAEGLAVKLHLLQILDYLNLKFSTF